MIGANVTIAWISNSSSTVKAALSFRRVTKKTHPGSSVYTRLNRA